MFRRIHYVAAGFVIIPLLLLLIVEEMVVGYVVSAARAYAVSPSGPTPQDILDAAAAADGTTTLLAVGDIADCDERSGFAKKLPNTARLLGIPSALDSASALANEAAALAADRPRVPILALGDTVYSKGRPIEYADCFEPTWGALKPRILPAPGNHEYKTLGAFGYFDYFGAQAGRDRRGWYAANVPGWLILSLNSEVDAGPGSEQSEWLAGRMAEAGDACILAFFHRPAHSLRERSRRENAIELFRQLHAGGATLVLNGHNHFYERTMPLDGKGASDPATGTVAFTVGTGGKINAEKPTVATTEAAAFGQVGLLELELRPGAYAWSYVDAQTREVIDQGTAGCNPGRS